MRAKLGQPLFDCLSLFTFVFDRTLTLLAGNCYFVCHHHHFVRYARQKVLCLSEHLKIDTALGENCLVEGKLIYIQGRKVAAIVVDNRKWLYPPPLSERHSPTHKERRRNMNCSESGWRVSLWQLPILPVRANIPCQFECLQRVFFY